MDMVQTAAVKKLKFISSDRSDCYMVDNLSIAILPFVCHILMSYIYVHKIWSTHQHYDPIYPTAPLGQDMTQGQFLSGVLQV